MRIRKALRADQEFTTRFLDVLGKGLVIAAQSKFGEPGFFALAGRFIHEYVEPVYFRKEEILLESLEDCGFAPDQGPVGNMRNGHRKSREISRALAGAARQWESGDQVGRAEVIWATSEYTSVMRSHFALLMNLIYPLLEQSFSIEEEQEVAARVSRLSSEDPSLPKLEQYLKVIQTMEEEVSDWR